ncbi:microtubule-associated serine/threonine-protein kinase 4-like [Anomaloglossus baeobatrachus]|uniref:microtubule-associated serine/threonine-protein kinase 4-like n=1 Tax=Anomaloglossus baeobatrachus TaxID=238106 RepID=UPI003F50CC0D
MSGIAPDKFQELAPLQGLLTTYSPESVLPPPDGALSFTYRLVMELVSGCLTKYDQGRITSEYLEHLQQNIRTLVQQELAPLQGLLTTYSPESVLPPPDGALSFTYRLVMELVSGCLTKYDQGRITSEYLEHLQQNIRTLVQQAERKSQCGDLAFFKELAQNVLDVLERPLHSLENLETAEGDSEEGQDPNISDSNVSQREIQNDLTEDITVPAIADGGICETPEIHESANAERKSQCGDLAVFKELAQNVLDVLERPLHSLENLETAEGDSEEGQNPNISDSNVSQREIQNDLTEDITVPAITDGGICETPESHESANALIRSSNSGRNPSKTDFKQIKLISSGAYGAVHLVRHNDTNKMFAMKKLNKQNLKDKTRLDRAFLERDILTFSDCPFVASMLCSFPSNRHLCMVMEYAAVSMAEISTVDKMRI